MPLRPFALLLLGTTAVAIAACHGANPEVKVAAAPLPSATAAPAQEENRLTRAQQDAWVAQASALMDDPYVDRDALYEAKGLLERVLAANPHHSQAHVEKARNAIKVGYNRDSKLRRSVLMYADDQLQQALAADPRNANAYVLLGLLRTYQTRYDDALAILHTAQAMGSDNPWLYLNYADTYFMMGQWDRAEQSLQTLEKERAARGAFPPNVEYALGSRWSKIRRHHHDFKAMRRDYLRELAAYPASASIRGEYAYFMLGGMRDPDAAIAEANRTIKMADYGEIHEIRGLAEYVKWDESRPRDPVKAKTYLAAAEADLPNRADAIVRAAVWVGASPQLQHLLLTFVAQGTSLDTIDSDGTTALVCAVYCGYPDSVEWLLDHGAKVDARDAGGSTAFMWAESRNHPESAVLLAGHGADVEAIFPEGGTGLYYAALLDQQGLVRTLLSLKARVDDGGPGHYSPLNEAAIVGSKSVVKLLLDAGANPSLRQSSDPQVKPMDAVELAEANHYDDIATMIRNYRKE